MAKVKVIQATCDRCGSVGDTGCMTGRDKWGELDLSWNGHRGSRSWAGDAAGVNLKGSKWICMSCMDSFFDWLKSGENPTESQLE